MESSFSSDASEFTPPRRRLGMVLQLPFDVWESISEYLRSDSLSHVCRSLWQGLRERYVTRRCRTAVDMRRAAACHPRVRVLQLALQCPQSPTLELPALTWRALRQACASLREALQALVLGLLGRSMADVCAGALGPLQDAGQLHTLCLELRGTGLGDRGAHALAVLKGSPALRTLTLGLCRNSVGPAGARALAQLRASATLQTLVLDLHGNVLGAGGSCLPPPPQHTEDRGSAMCVAHAVRVLG